MSNALQNEKIADFEQHGLKRPLAIAHRGGAGLRPENTLAAIDHALALGANGVEIDVHLTRDAIPVVHHDARLRADIARTADERWLNEPGPIIAESTALELKQYDVGRLNPDSAYAALYPEQVAVDGQVIPTLSEVLDHLRERSDDAIAIIEIKTPFSNTDFEHSDLVNAVLRVVADKAMDHRIRIMAFEWRALDRARHAAPEVPRGHTTIPGLWLADRAPAEHLLLPEATRQHLSALVRSGPPFMRGYSAGRWTTELIDIIARDPVGFWTASHYDVTPGMARYAVSRNIEIFAWTVDSREAMSRMVALNIAGVITDYPDRYLNL